MLPNKKAKLDEEPDKATITIYTKKAGAAARIVIKGTIVEQEGEMDDLYEMILQAEMKGNQGPARIHISLNT